MTLCPDCNKEMKSRVFNNKVYNFCSHCQKEIVCQQTLDKDLNKDAYMKVKNILTPDIVVCDICIDEHKSEISCNICGAVLIKPVYTGRVYECPVCEKRFCDRCWNK